MGSFVIIEAGLRKINKNRLIEDFKKSEELEQAPNPEKLIITKIIDEQDWSKDDSYYRSLASHFDHACCEYLNESSAKPNKKVEFLVQEIIKVIKG